MGIQPYHQKVYNDLLKGFETIKKREEVKNQLFAVTELRHGKINVP